MNQSKSQRAIKLKSKLAKLSLENPIFPLSNKKISSTICLNNAKSPNNFNGNSGFLSTSNRTKIKELYYNVNLFKKRQFLFSKSKREHNKVFKYRNIILYDRKNATTRNKCNLRTKKIDPFESIDYSKIFLTDNENLLPALNFKSFSNEFIEQFKKNDSSKEKRKNKNVEKIKYIHKRKPPTKLIKNNIMMKMDIYKNIRNKSLLPSVFISDFRYYLSQKMNVKIKKEKAQKLKENEIEKIEYINDKINTIEKNYSLFNNTFVNKSNKYLRGINIIKEYEKNKDELLIEKLIDLKNKVNFLNAKVKKIEFNNNSFKQWIYLQICLKEKIIKLPESYKIILESKDDNKNILIEKFGEDLVNHVIKYKNSLLYKNAKEFLDQFTLYENKNFELLNKYFEIKEEIRALEIEKKQAKENNVIEKKEKKLNESVIRQTKELNRLKNENIYLEKFKKKLIVSKTQTKKKETNLIEVYKNIYSQTVNIIKNINLLNYDSCINIQTDIYYQNLSEQQKILHNLAKIERIIDILVKNSKLYKQLYSEKMKAIKNLIEKEKKFVNNSEKILKMKLKMEEERQRILKKNNKIIILPKHKLVIDYKINKKSQNSNELSKKRNKSVENINAYFSEY